VKVSVKVQRLVEGRSWVQEYVVDVNDPKKTTVLDLLIRIREKIDPTLAFRYACRMGVCGACGMVINGEPKLACTTTISETGPVIEVEPLWNFPVIRDLVVDMGEFFRKHKLVKPWAENKGAKVTKEEQDRFLQYAYCIYCGICYAACPKIDDKFYGPQAAAKLLRWLLDPRGGSREERLKIAAIDAHLESCEYVGTCTLFCPKDVDPAHAILRLKVDAYKAMRSTQRSS